jgi:orotidine-5'-phosphate decarboxylase
MNATFQRRIIVPLDVSTTEEALLIVRRLKGRAGMFKVGLQLFCSEGPDVVRRILGEGERVFLDLKLHDIPNTVARAVAATTQLGVSMMDVHLSGGEKMLRAAVEALEPRGSSPRPLLLGITALTSLDQQDLAAIGVRRELPEQVVQLARLGLKAGLDGVVASPLEIGAIKAACGSPFVVVTPGIRPTGAAPGDQKRFLTPAAALQAGADYLVIGRPILEASDPAAALDAIAAEMSA